MITRLRAWLAGSATLLVAILTLLLRRRDRQLQEVKIQASKCQDDLENHIEQDKIDDLKTKVGADEKDRAEKDRRLDGLLTSDERRRLGRG